LEPKYTRKNLPLSTIIFGSKFRGWLSGSSFADVSLGKVFSWKTSLGNKKGSVLPKQLSPLFGSVSSSSKKMQS